MIFPDFIKKEDIIGVTAPSDGNRKDIDYKRLDLASESLEACGYSVLLTGNVRTSVGGRSSSANQRASQVMGLFENKDVKSIILAKGGDFLMEILPLLDFEKIKENPKWIQGYSDNTGLLFTITTMCDIATIYSNHFNDFAMQPWHESIVYNMNILQGNLVKQRSFVSYENEFWERETGREGYRLTEPVRWHGTENPVEIRGRMIGGCLDVLLNLVGTRFDFVKEYVKQYEKDGILWYLESFSLDAESITRGLWQLREAGWFENVKGFVFGRPCMFESFLGYTYAEAVLSALEPLHVPVIFDADVGHKAPQFTVVNGAIGTWKLRGEKGSLTTEFPERYMV